LAGEHPGGWLQEGCVLALLPDDAGADERRRERSRHPLDAPSEKDVEPRAVLFGAHFERDVDEIVYDFCGARAEEPSRRRKARSESRRSRRSVKPRASPAIWSGILTLDSIVTPSTRKSTIEGVRIVPFQRLG